ncbi:hypothetical protein TNIN_412071 [Trichonephila inaurata madagascariensis]|uniref:Uncharacterized protein n=1 Tax=Trichonephila inaurata madagascariensis TaxID=2747483 RepID=A0A8X6M927_9ARAC|nr:hypothetical protein TNIN_412071 [Trichonephila inaurata madagascariensis]
MVQWPAGYVQSASHSNSVRSEDQVWLRENFADRFLKRFRRDFDSRRTSLHRLAHFYQSCPKVHRGHFIRKSVERE